VAVRELLFLLHGGVVLLCVAAVDVLLEVFMWVCCSWHCVDGVELRRCVKMIFEILPAKPRTPTPFKFAIDHRSRDSKTISANSSSPPMTQPEGKPKTSIKECQGLHHGFPNLKYTEHRTAITFTDPKTETIASPSSSTNPNPATTFVLTS
jgi:hypothetical protein